LSFEQVRIRSSNNSYSYLPHDGLCDQLTPKSQKRTGIKIRDLKAIVIQLTLVIAFLFGGPIAIFGLMEVYLTFIVSVAEEKGRLESSRLAALYIAARNCWLPRHKQQNHSKIPGVSPSVVVDDDISRY
jgi:hypothetical protein